MNIQNKYCTKCKRTEHFSVDGSIFTCPHCGTSTDISKQTPNVRIMIGSPFAQYRTETINILSDDSKSK